MAAHSFMANEMLQNQEKICGKWVRKIRDVFFIG